VTGEQATIEGAVQSLRPKLMTVTAVLPSLRPILWETGIGSDMMKPNRRAGRWRHDYVDYSRIDPSAGIFRDDEATRFGKATLGATEEVNETDTVAMPHR
jgi:hypothetical protein